MRISDRGLAFIRQWESCRLKAYQDSGGVWTIGWGHTPAKQGQTITQFEADEMFRMDVEEREIQLNTALAGVPTKQCEYDALLSLLYNIGIGRKATADKPEIKGLITSTVLKRHRLGNKTGAANAFLNWKYDNGVVVPGLLRRREAERKMYLGEA